MDRRLARRLVALAAAYAVALNTLLPVLAAVLPPTAVGEVGLTVVCSAGPPERGGPERGAPARPTTAAMSLRGGLRDAGLRRDRVAGPRCGRRRAGLRAHRVERARARRSTGADDLARRQQARPWSSGRLTATLAAIRQFQ
jgi:hypothetical protein